MPIPVANNRWEDPNGFIVRANVPLSDIYSLDQYTANTVECQTECSQGGGNNPAIQDYCSFGSEFNYGNWATLDETSIDLDNHFSFAVNFMLNEQNPPHCRLIKANDALQATYQNDEDTIKLPQLKSYYDIIIARDSLDTLVSAALLLKGFVHELLNENDSALILYNFILANHSNSDDSLISSWSISRLNFIQSDTLESSTAYSLRFEYYNAKLEYIREPLYDKPIADVINLDVNKKGTLDFTAYYSNINNELRVMFEADVTADIEI